jgi:hypothetical protein
MCSAGANLICRCGQILTPEERHWYGDGCERCQRELDALFERPQQH